MHRATRAPALAHIIRSTSMRALVVSRHLRHVVEGALALCGEAGDAAAGSSADDAGSSDDVGGTAAAPATALPSAGGGSGRAEAALLKGLKATPLRHIVWLDDEADAHAEALAAHRRRQPAPAADPLGAPRPALSDCGLIKEHSWGSVLRRGAALPVEVRRRVAVLASPHCVVKLLPSSGSTGLPKLIVVTEGMLQASGPQSYYN